MGLKIEQERFQMRNKGQVSKGKARKVLEKFMGSSWKRYLKAFTGLQEQVS